MPSVSMRNFNVRPALARGQPGELPDQPPQRNQAQKVDDQHGRAEIRPRALHLGARLPEDVVPHLRRDRLRTGGPLGPRHVVGDLELHERLVLEGANERGSRRGGERQIQRHLPSGQQGGARVLGRRIDIHRRPEGHPGREAVDQERHRGERHGQPDERAPGVVGEFGAAGHQGHRQGAKYRARVRWINTVVPGPGQEARARRTRYAALADLAREVGAARIVTGHTQDDQAETLVLRLLRGAGRRGLGGMRPARGRLFRPLLGVTRADVRRFLAERGLPFMVDRTNADLAFARNRIRRLVIPFLAAEFNPRLGASLASLAARLRDEEDFLAAAAAARAAGLVSDDRLHASVAAEPAALARRIVRAWLERGARRSPSALHVERVLALATGGGRGTVAVPGPARVLREGDSLVRRPGRVPAPRALVAPIVPGGTVVDPAGRWRLSLSAARPRRAGED